MTNNLWSFSDKRGSFKSALAHQFKSLYLPFCNEKIMSSISPDLRGDIKLSQDSFLLEPVSRINLSTSSVSRNFWVHLANHKAWSATGVSKDLRQITADSFHLEAGLLWQKITRENRSIGLKSEILSFVPASGEPVEIMQVSLTNISGKKIKIIPFAAIPIYARSADNLRDHRHVTSLLQRIFLHKYGVIVRPTLSFNEAGHTPNKTDYFVLGWEENSRPPQYLYPTQEMFCGESGDLEAPESVLKNLLPGNRLIQGKEAMGALRFAEISLGAGKSRTYIIVMGISERPKLIPKIISKFNSLQKINRALTENKKFWLDIPGKINLKSGNADFDCWFSWVSIQPVLRKIFGCSFLPDFDYGKGGRGWRDLWQDCLGLTLNQPHKVRELLLNNFSGVRIDGSNATIIGKKPGEFISDRNNISRVWMDHGIWPLLSLDLYLQETGDLALLSKEVPYFRDYQLCRGQEKDEQWNKSCGQKLKTSAGKVYLGSILEHLLVENLVQFFNVGRHNCIRLEGADWNDGLDMAKDNGESVAFSAMYARNLEILAGLILKAGKNKIRLAQELKILFASLNYNDIKAKRKVLRQYFSQTKFCLKGKKIELDAASLAADLQAKGRWLKNNISKKEWLKEGFFNGYYDNLGRRVEGKKNNLVRICLASQVFPITSGVASEGQIKRLLASINKYLVDKKLGGIHLNSDFKEEQQQLGRAFSFVYGEKENGSFFNHMSVMLAFALYRCGRAEEAWKVLNSTYAMSISPQALIYPCLPEYFNSEGRGMYAYLTGSASWFILTLLTESFGIKGQDGNLVIEPKLSASQFRHTNSLSINRFFAGRKLIVSFANPRKLKYGSYSIRKATLNKRAITITRPLHLFIPRSAIRKLPQAKENHLEITLG